MAEKDQAVPFEGATSAAHFRDWSHLVSDLLGKIGDEGFIWRGQRVEGWGLESSLERAFLFGGVPDDERGNREQRAFSYFRAHAATYLQRPPADDDTLSWLVIMQHYSAPTRLLDWTESPFVATYFAYRDMSHNQQEPAALWLYDARHSVMTLRTRDETELDVPRPRDTPSEDGVRRAPWADEINKLVRQHIESRSSMPLPVVPLQPDARMTAQQTVLTVDARLDGGVPYPLSGSASLPLLFKIELMPEWRRDVLRELALMGITDATLFADVSGVAQHASRIVRDGFRHVRNELEGH